MPLMKSIKNGIIIVVKKYHLYLLVQYLILMRLLFMKIHLNKYFFFLTIMYFIIMNISAQRTDQLWNRNDNSEINSINKMERRTVPTSFEVFNLDVDNLKHTLQNTPKRKGKTLKSSTIVSFPNANGTLEQFEIFEASVLGKSLQEKYPNIKSYIGKSVENPETIIRFSLSKIGFQAMITQAKEGVVYIDPFTSNKKSYIVYSKNNIAEMASFECKFNEVNAVSKGAAKTIAAKTANANDGKLRTFRLAVATTGEYSQFQLTYNGVSANASDTEKKEVVLSAINATMTRVNAIFERDVSLTMELVANNTAVIFLDPDTDGFTNDDGNILINQSQTIIDNNIGFGNYDIGHTFSTGGGGLATLNSPCTSSKAKGVTGSSFPIGDTYDIDFVAHEMGHQFGANHTFNGEEGSCADGNINNATAVEPGSGSTIMSYAGLCAPENVQSQSDDYFHLVSVQEIWNNITNGNSTCAETTATGNSPPIVDALASYTLPISTPFVLNATAADPNSGDVLTYTWEQLDTGIAIAPPVSTATEGPVFRSVSASTSSMRYFPNQTTVSTGATSNRWERLPSVSRTMNFGVNVRDNNVNGGQSANQEVEITFEGSAGPFKVTSQNLFEAWVSGENKTVSWDVANSNSTPVGCANVNILLSTDGGFTFPIILKSNTPNNGTASVVVPNVTSTQTRIKVESVGNIFYAINEVNISVQAKEFEMNFVADNAKVCKTENAVYNFTYNTYLEFNEVTTFSATGNPVGTTVSFNPTTAAANDTNVEVTISDISSIATGDYSIDIVGISGITSLEKTTTISLAVFESTLTAPILTTPVNNTLALKKPYDLGWEADGNAESYDIQIATDVSFNSIIEEATVNTNFYEPQLLAINTKYYWRVVSKNTCGGVSNFSSVFDFTTANEICDMYVSTDIPKSIPDNDPDGVSSTISIPDNKLISKVKVKVSISHTYVEDLLLELTSSKGITILLSVANGGDGNNYTNTTFDDSASISIANGSAPFNGSFKPQIPLAYLNDTESQGNWTLKVVDSGEADTGTIDSWSLEICGVPTVSSDDDNDGIANTIDQCPNTAFGNSVDDLGCFKYPENNFEIKTIGETCIGNANGQIVITTKKEYNYSTTINGVLYNFTSSITISDLAAGTYDFCIGVYVDDEDKTFEQCFTVLIEAGTIVEGKAVVSDNKVAIEISQGSPPYKVLVNGKVVFETAASLMSIDVNHGDKITVKTGIECEGLFLTEIDLIAEIIAYPNPTNGLFEISLPTSKREVNIALYTMQSQLISSNMYPVINGKVRLTIENKPTGVYIAKVYLDKPIALKIIKK